MVHSKEELSPELRLGRGKSEMVWNRGKYESICRYIYAMLNATG